ncbi:MAG: NAD(P)H-binding protein [Gemmatimonadaceae bacterium]
MTDPQGIPIVVTGATGAIGRYVIDELLATTSSWVTVIARDESHARSVFRETKRVNVLQGDVREGASLARRIPVVERAVLLATSWEDGQGSNDVNVEGQVAFAREMRARGLQRLIWFGTASILEHDGAPLALAESLGSPYIASKARARARLIDETSDVLSIIHPTMVVGAGIDRPWSHFARLVPQIEKRAWLARYFSGEGSFHLVHASDLATMTRDLLFVSPNESMNEVVAGAPSIILAEALDLVLERARQERRARVDLTPRRVALLTKAFRVRLSAWDRYCLATRHFTYDAAKLRVNETSPPHHPTARDILATIPR